MALASHSGRGFIVSKFQGLFNRIHGACLKPSEWDPRGLFVCYIRVSTREAGFRFVKLS